MRSPAGVTGLCLVALVVLVALFGAGLAPSDPFRVTADPAHGAAIVAFTSVSDGTTRLARITPNGTRTDIAGSFPFLAGGLAADAVNIYGCGNAATCQSVPNQ